MRNPRNDTLDAHIPERTCILSRRTAPREELIRLALSPDGEVAPDVRARAPGRGAWIGVTRAEVDAAQAKGKLKGALQRAFKSNDVTVPADLGERTERALRQAALDRLGMEARAGNLINGADKVETAAREERRALGVDDALAEMPHLSEQMLVTLGKANIRTLDDLADLATDELIQKKRVEPRRREPSNRPEDKGGILSDYGLSEEQGNEIIMAARAHWFDDEPAEGSAKTEEAADAETSE